MVGAVIAGKYRIESLIGSGGMANVYKAYDEQEGRTVAIKMLKAEHREDTEFLRRFEREASSFASLSEEFTSFISAYSNMTLLPVSSA